MAKENFSDLPPEEIGDEIEDKKPKKKPAKVEMPSHIVLTEREYKEEMKRRKEDPHWRLEQP